MKTTLSLILLAAVLCAGPAFAADPILGTWKLNVAKSKFIPDAALTASTRTYTEAKRVYTLEQKLTGADGKETSYQTHYRDGKEERQTATGFVDATARSSSMQTPGISCSRKVAKSSATCIE
jgi:hypothetical protein